jgi:hypothetical protein
VGFAPTGKRRLVTAHRHSGHREALKPEASVAIDPTATSGRMKIDAILYTWLCTDGARVIRLPISQKAVIS